MALDEWLAERLSAPATTDECLIWQGAMTRNLMPVLRSKSIRTMVYEKHVEKLPPTWRLNLTCGNPRCLNEMHMSPTTKRARLFYTMPDDVVKWLCRPWREAEHYG